MQIYKNFQKSSLLSVGFRGKNLLESSSAVAPYLKVHFLVNTASEHFFILNLFSVVDVEALSELKLGVFALAEEMFRVNREDSRMYGLSYCGGALYCIRLKSEEDLIATLSLFFDKFNGRGDLVWEIVAIKSADGLFFLTEGVTEIHFLKEALALNKQLGGVKLQNLNLLLSNATGLINTLVAATR